MKSKLHNSRGGFTIIELLIATTIFSVILLMASSAIVHIGRIYYKGLTQNKTQEAVRIVAEEVTRSVQFAKGTKVPGPTPETATGGSFCIGDTRYTYTINQRVNPDAGQNALVAQRLNGQACTTNPLTDPGKELLSKNMRLLRFSVTPELYDADTYSVGIRIAYGDNDLLTAYADDATETTPPIGPIATAACKSGNAGSSFCATAQLDTVVKRRLN